MGWNRVKGASTGDKNCIRKQRHIVCCVCAAIEQYDACCLLCSSFPSSQLSVLYFIGSFSFYHTSALTLLLRTCLYINMALFSCRLHIFSLFVCRHESNISRLVDVHCLPVCYTVCSRLFQTGPMSILLIGLDAFHQVYVIYSTQ